MEVGGPACILNSAGQLAAVMSAGTKLRLTAALLLLQVPTVCHCCATHTFFSAPSVNLRMEECAKANVSMLTHNNNVLRSVTWSSCRGRNMFRGRAAAASSSKMNLVTRADLPSKQT